MNSKEIERGEGGLSLGSSGGILCTIYEHSVFPRNVGGISRVAGELSASQKYSAVPSRYFKATTIPKLCTFRPSAYAVR